MLEKKPVNALATTTDLAHEQREWLMERIGWSAMALIVVAALLGIFGSGPLATAAVGARSGPLWVEYNRFERKLAPSTLAVHFTPAALHQGELRLLLDDAYVRAVNIIGTTPATTRQEMSADGVVFVFTALPLQGPAQIELQIYPSVIGRVQGRMGLEDAPPLTFTQFIYP